MGLFGGGYAKEGKGVSKMEPTKKRLFYFFELLFRKFGKIIEVNFLFLLGAVVWALVPSVIGLLLMQNVPEFFKTLFCIGMGFAFCGPSMAGMTYILRNMANKQSVFLISDFLDNMKDNWKQSLAVSVLETLITAVIFVSASFYWDQMSTNSIMGIPFVVTIIFALIFAFAAFYPYLMIVTLDLKFTAIVKNSFIFAMAGMKSNFFTLLSVGGLAFLAIWYYPISALPMLVLGFSLVTFIICFNSYQHVEKYCIKPYYEKLRNSGELEEDDEVVFQDTVGTDRKPD